MVSSQGGEVRSSRLAHNQKFAGSNPAPASNFREATASREADNGQGLASQPILIGKAPYRWLALGCQKEAQPGVSWSFLHRLHRGSQGPNQRANRTRITTKGKKGLKSIRRLSLASCHGAARLLVAFLFVISLHAQPTIQPSTITVAPGSTQQFTTSAKNALWLIASTFYQGESIDQTGLFTAPKLPAWTTSITAIVRVYDRNAGYTHADATVTVAAVAPSTTPCGCGDIFVVSSTPAPVATFSKQPDGTWTALIQATLPLFIQITRNGTRAKESDVSGITYANGMLTLSTAIPWDAGDTVTAKWVVMNK